MIKKKFTKASLINLFEIKNLKGNILKILNKNEKFFTKFGEVYLSRINNGSIKAWKKHKKIHLNLTVISGAVKFVIYNDLKNKFTCMILKEKDKKRIHIPAGLWFGFKGLKNNSIILSISSHIANSREVLRKKLKEIKFDW